MKKISAQINPSICDALETRFCELNDVNWAIERDGGKSPTFIRGFFDDETSAISEYSKLRSAIGGLPESFSLEDLDDLAWQNEYKKYLTSWNFKGLHWVPVWMKPDYSAPRGDKVFYFDAGLAFGTGDHPTTRMCAMAMIDYLKRCPDPKSASVIDAGCGSGILALSAKLLGFEKIYGFDRDEEAIRASNENAKLNSIPAGEVEFELAGVEKALKNRKADLMLANIQADILCIYAGNLISAMNPGGALVLSGILCGENKKVEQHFSKLAKGRLADIKPNFMENWSSLELNFI